MLLLALAFVLLIVAMTRPGPGRMFRGRYRRPLRPTRKAAGTNAGLHDPSRPL